MTALAGRTALVSGASRGIGLAIAHALARAGVTLTFLSRTKPTVPGTHIPCDLADSDSLTQALSHVGTPDFLIHNAGVFLEQPIPEIPLADWDRVFRVNVTAPFLITRAVLPGMIARKSGRIINIASTASSQGYLHQSAYVASKHALLGFARSLALECKPHNIHVHTLCPGGVDTDLIKGTYLAERMQGQNMIAPADIAEMVLFLLRQPPNIDVPEIVIRRFQP